MLPFIESGKNVQGLSLYYFLQLLVNVQLSQFFKKSYDKLLMFLLKIGGRRGSPCVSIVKFQRERLINVILIRVHQ